MISNMVMEWKVGQMEVTIRESINRVRNMVKVDQSSKMVVIMKEICFRMNSKALVYMSGLMVKDTKDNGMVTKCVVEVS